MYAARDEDSAQLVAARNTILSNIKKWLNGKSALKLGSPKGNGNY